MVLVNCDDEGDKKQDCLDSTYSSDDDLAPIVIEIGKPLEDLYDQNPVKVFLVAEPVNGNNEGSDSKNRFRIFDDNKKELLVAANAEKEVEITKYFNSKEKLEAKIEALQFSREVKLRMEVRKDSHEVILKDEVSIRSCPFLVNNNTNEEIATMGSDDYRFFAADKNGNGFVQDGAEYGFQALKLSDSQKAMYVQLTLFQPGGGQINLNLRGNVGKYDDLEDYYEKNSNGDQGGNVEGIPVGANGKIIVGSTISQKLQTFFKRQVIQGIVTVPITQIGLAHIDELVYINGKTLYQISYSQTKPFIEGLLEDRLQLKSFLTNDRTGRKNAWVAFVEHFKNNHKIDLNANFKNGKILNHVSAAIDSAVKKAGMKIVYIPQLHYISARFAKSFPSGVANSALRKGATYTNTDANGNHNGRAKAAIQREWKNKMGNIKLVKKLGQAWSFGGETHCASNSVHKYFEVK